MPFLPPNQQRQSTEGTKILLQYLNIFGTSLDWYIVSLGTVTVTDL